MEWVTYRCHKEVEAAPMTRGEYNKYRSWELPVDEDGSDAGYIVKYEDGYISWTPKKQLDEGYTKL